jgi:hypothetical protein
LKLEPGEAEVLALDARAFAQAVADPTARVRFEQLALAASGGDVPDVLLPPLQTMLELIFEKGRPSNRAVLQAVYAKTPRGKQQTIAAREVNKALRTLRGHTLQDVRITAGPSKHTLIVETDRVRLTLELDSAGARVSSLETG